MFSARLSPSFRYGLYACCALRGDAHENKSYLSHFRLCNSLCKAAKLHFAALTNLYHRATCLDSIGRLAYLAFYCSCRFVDVQKRAAAVCFRFRRRHHRMQSLSGTRLSFPARHQIVLTCNVKEENQLYRCERLLPPHFNCNRCLLFSMIYDAALLVLCTYYAIKARKGKTHKLKFIFRVNIFSP